MSASIHDRIASDIEHFGGVLRCSRCGHPDATFNIAGSLASGWPTCHGLTMTWWTQRQIDSGEMSRAVGI